MLSMLAVLHAKEDTWIKRYTAHQFYKVIDKLAGKVKVPSNVGHFRLISRRVLLEILKLQEHNRVFRVQVPLHWLSDGRSSLCPSRSRTR